MTRRNRWIGGPLRWQRQRLSLFSLSLLTGLVLVALASLLARPAGGAPVDLGQEVVKPAAPHYPVDWIHEPDHLNTRLDRRERGLLEEQRKLVSELAKRYFGRSLTRTQRDLDVLQRLVDEHLVDRKQRFDLQALGVALGDVMVRELGFEWIAHVDDLARTRALRLPGSSDVLFPVTMISRRIEAGARVDVAELFAEARSIADRSQG